MSGEQAQAGRDLLDAVRFAAEEWNLKGGVLGKKIVVESADDKGDPEQAAKIAAEWKGQKPTRSSDTTTRRARSPPWRSTTKIARSW